MTFTAVGELLFFEHGIHPDPTLAAKQRRGEARHYSGLQNYATW